MLAMSWQNLDFEIKPSKEDDYYFTSLSENYKPLSLIKFYYFSSNSCNFFFSAGPERNNCPKGYVFCKSNESKPELITEQMTFHNAKTYCAKRSSFMCE